MEQEKKERAAAVAGRKAVETRIVDLEQQLDLVARVRDDSVRHLKKLQNQLKEDQREIDELKAQKEQLALACKEMEKKYKTLENQTVQWQEDTLNADRLRKNAENERDELDAQLQNLKLTRYVPAHCKAVQRTSNLLLFKRFRLLLRNRLEKARPVSVLVLYQVCAEHGLDG